MSGPLPCFYIAIIFTPRAGHAPTRLRFSLMMHRSVIRFQLYDAKMVGPFGLYGIAQGVDELDAAVLLVGHVLSRHGMIH